jgi:hypothetical protein
MLAVPTIVQVDAFTMLSILYIYLREIRENCRDFFSTTSLWTSNKE